MSGAAAPADRSVAWAKTARWSAGVCGLLACAGLTAALTSPAHAWGATGHRIISRVAAEKLPAEVPEFVRVTDAVDEIAALGPEADRLKGSGATWDADHDRAHFVDIADDGRIAGTLTLSGLPPTREAYDTALRAAGTDQYKVGYLPYELIDGYEQVVTDFAYWRVDVVGERSGATDEDKRYFTADRKLREALTVRDIGYWSHFVADASQPLHVSVHYNGWGDYPNPKGYSNSHTIHARFETTLVSAAASEGLVASRMPPYAPSTLTIQARIAAYLRASAAGVPRVYALEAAGGIDAVSPDAAAFVVERLTAGAAMLRDLTTDAWTASAGRSVGYPAVAVPDVEGGKVILTRAAFGAD
jgi:hypothetical protein